MNTVSSIVSGIKNTVTAITNTIAQNTSTTSSGSTTTVTTSSSVQASTSQNSSSTSSNNSSSSSPKINTSPSGGTSSTIIGAVTSVVAGAVTGSVTGAITGAAVAVINAVAQTPNTTTSGSNTTVTTSSSVKSSTSTTSSNNSTSPGSNSSPQTSTNSSNGTSSTIIGAVTNVVAGTVTGSVTGAIASAVATVINNIAQTANTTTSEATSSNVKSSESNSSSSSNIAKVATTIVNAVTQNAATQSTSTGSKTTVTTSDDVKKTATKVVDTAADMVTTISKSLSFVAQSTANKNIQTPASTASTIKQVTSLISQTFMGTILGKGNTGTIFGGAGNILKGSLAGAVKDSEDVSSKYRDIKAINMPVYFHQNTSNMPQANILNTSLLSSTFKGNKTLLSMSGALSAVKSSSISNPVVTATIPKNGDTRKLLQFGMGDPTNKVTTDESKIIMQLQKDLELLGYLDTGGYYGYYGKDTKGAANEFKKDHKLDNTGVNEGKVGITTLASIQQEVNNVKNKKTTSEKQKSTGVKYEGEHKFTIKGTNIELDSEQFRQGIIVYNVVKNGIFKDGVPVSPENYSYVPTEVREAKSSNNQRTTNPYAIGTTANFRVMEEEQLKSSNNNNDKKILIHMQWEQQQISV
ncbi:hypothetical protein [Cellulosilyticum lentocellum]|uniref:Peptidoglycan-binding domain 1 protein n=1 Tax=Cellulosilyticum lentocellum (strain ATCC 49066 / DSM 5427 / NCIMB 11756 / RHM5) TaxID=642492 RepID=F2JLA2_CELLD|nr:hypothetical protein [Cellulosilyticum lentocellum]ADZ85747.1 Peptidoglycan-binding domain 1 protein [Cellulosilyticum lentocellum DSM 5427]